MRRRKVANPNLDSGEAKESADGSRRLAALSGVTLHEVLEPLLRLLQVMGVSRKEVLAVVRKLPIVKLAAPVTVVRGRLEYWSQAVMRWAADPKFLGVDGRPRDLAFSSGELSFCDLVALSLPRERPALCRDILLATGAIIRLPSGRLRWRERAALAWTEALTLVAETGAPDADYELIKAEFTEAEQVNLTFAIGAINTWNRLQVGFRALHAVEESRDAA